MSESAAGPSSNSTTAILGVGHIGSTLARLLVNGGEAVVVASTTRSEARALADELGPLARFDSVAGAVAGADTVVLAMWLDAIKQVVPEQAASLEGKVVVDPSNPIGFDEAGQITRTLPDNESAGCVVAGLLPAGAHYVKAFGTLAADALGSGANRTPRRATLFYATDDDTAAVTVERLIHAAGFDALKAGGVADSGRIEAPGGDLHHFGLAGKFVDLDQARAALAAKL